MQPFFFLLDVCDLSDLCVCEKEKEEEFFFSFSFFHFSRPAYFSNSFCLGARWLSPSSMLSDLGSTLPLLVRW